MMRASRPDTTPSMAAIAVSRNTGATASYSGEQKHRRHRQLDTVGQQLGVHQSALLATWPLACTNQRSLVKGLPCSVASIQSATSAGAAGPRLAEGTPPTE